jgi:zinc transport system permease protein
MTDLGAWSAALGVAPRSLVAALLASVLCGFVGTLVVLRRLVALGGGLAHAAFGGIGLAVTLGFEPRLGAAGVAALSAAVLSGLGESRRDRQDAVIGVLWAVGMATGMWLLSGIRGSAVDVEGLLFGDITRIRTADLIALGVLDAIVLAVHFFAGREIAATAFDAENASLQDVPVRALSFLFLLLVAFSVVALLALAGVVLVIALLAIPPLVSLRLFRGLPAAVLGACAVGLVMSLGGLVAAARLGGPAGPAVVLVGAVLLALSRLVPRRAGRAHRPA